MDLAERFEQYAGDFERTLADDDWSRVRRHFTDDAVHERYAGVLYSFRHQGADAIVERLRDMVDHVDRRFDRRFLVRTGPVEQHGDRTIMPWVGIYILDGVPALLGEGREIATFVDGKIHHLLGDYTEDTIQRMLDWGAKYGSRLPGLAEYLASFR